VKEAGFELGTTALQSVLSTRSMHHIPKHYNIGSTIQRIHWMLYAQQNREKKTYGEKCACCIIYILGTVYSMGSEIGCLYDFDMLSKGK
jgi:hypothetical protein